MLVATIRSFDVANQHQDPQTASHWSIAATMADLSRSPACGPFGPKGVGSANPLALAIRLRLIAINLMQAPLM
jgi:hypothetical protein